MSYYENQRSKVAIMWELQERGWEVFGYKADESDSMVDYYSPAHWDGIATKNGYVLLVDVFGLHYSGKKITKQVFKVDNEKIQKLYALANDPAASVGERENSLRKIEELRQKAKDSEIVVSQYPEFKNSNPSRNNWHIEKDGVIIAKGNGAFKCGQWDEAERKEAVTKFVDRIEKAISKGTKVEAKTVDVKETEIQPVVTESGKIEKGQHIKLNSNFTYGCSKGVYELYYVGTSFSVLYFGRMNKKLNKMMSTNTRGNQLTLTVEQFNKYLEKGTIQYVELKEVEITVEKTVFIETEREEEAEAKTESAMIEGEVIAESVEENTTEQAETTVTMNNAKNGVEIKFSKAPIKEVLDKLNASNFKYSSRLELWYAKQTEENISFANSFLPKDEVNNFDPVEEVEIEQTEYPSNVVPFEKPKKRGVSSMFKKSILTVLVFMFIFIAGMSKAQAYTEYKVADERIDIVMYDIQTHTYYAYCHDSEDNSVWELQIEIRGEYDQHELENLQQTYDGMETYITYDTNGGSSNFEDWTVTDWKVIVDK